MKLKLAAAAGSIAVSFLLTAPGMSLADRHMATGDSQHAPVMKHAGVETGSERFRADSLVGRRIVNRNSAEIGVIEAIVREKSTDDLSAVVSVGGFLGIGETEVSVPISDIRVWGNYLKVEQANSEKVLEARTLYREPLYTDVPESQMVSIERMPTGASASRSMEIDSKGDFSALDVDNDGYLSKQEAMQRSGLYERWQEGIDKNRDGRIDEKEFSAFEAGEREQSTTGSY